MELVRNQTTGRLTVFLNGTAYFGCHNDLDCPGLAFCRSQQQFDWIDGPNSSTTQCICPWFLGTQGALCDEQTNYTWGLIAVILAYGIFNLAAMLITMRVIWIVLKRRRKEGWNGSQTAMVNSTSSTKKQRRSWIGFAITLSSMFLATFFTTMYSVHWMIRLVRVHDIIIVEENGLSTKQSALWLVERVALISFVAFATAMNNFSLVWIEVLDSATRVVRSRASLRNYKIFLTVLYTATFSGIVACMILGQFTSFALVCSPAIVVVFVFGGVAFFKVRTVEKVMVRKHLASNNSDDQAKTPILRLLRQVRATAGLVFLFTFCLLVCALGYAISEDRPDGYIQQFFGMLVYFFGGLDELVVSIFILKTLRRPASPSASNGGSLSGKPNQRPLGQDPQQQQHLAVVTPMEAECDDLDGSNAISSLPANCSTNAEEVNQAMQPVDDSETKIPTDVVVCCSTDEAVHEVIGGMHEGLPKDESA